jgi:hypothetical protein
MVDYNRYSEYREADAIGDIYILENDRYIKGAGFDIKLGAIFRPFKYSPFKIGVSVHTPTWYSLNQYTWARITDPWNNQFSTVDSDRFGSEVAVKCNLSSPWRFNASMAYTFGTYLALNAEYELVDYKMSRFTNYGNVNQAQNVEIECNMKTQHIVRVGAELNVKSFALRVGYNYMTSPFRSDAYKNLLENASVAETSTEYMNRFEKNIYTCGLGFRGKIYYFDLAYMMEKQKADFYPFYDAEIANPGAQVKQTNHIAMVTLGARF